LTVLQEIEKLGDRLQPFVIASGGATLHAEPRHG
jgi:hypothetical protein